MSLLSASISHASPTSWSTIENTSRLSKYPNQIKITLAALVNIEAEEPAPTRSLSATYFEASGDDTCGKAILISLLSKTGLESHYHNREQGET